MDDHDARIASLRIAALETRLEEVERILCIKRAEVGAKSSGRSRPVGQAYSGCPVVAVGLHGQFFVFRDTLGERRMLDYDSLTKSAEIRDLFGGRVDLLMAQWPYYQGGHMVGWRREAAADALMLACYEMGPWKFETQSSEDAAPI